MAADGPVLTSDFESGQAPWGPRGPATVSVVDTDAHGGTRSLSVSGRTAGWQGTQANIVSNVVPGGTYTVSGWIKLAEDTSTTAKFTVAEKVGDAAEAYKQVNNPVTVTDDAWVEMTGTYTVPEGATSVVLYPEPALATVSFLIDDVTVTGPVPGSEEPAEFVPGGAVNPTTTLVETARGTGQVAALTFDDGPNPGETEDLLDYLAANDLTATFCLIGQNVTANPAIAKRIYDEGHTLCNHSTSYADMGAFSEAQVEADLKANLAAIRAAVGDPNAKVPYFRAPNGSWGKTPGVAVELGMQPLGLGNTINDWSTQVQSTLEANLRNAIQPGKIALVHDGGGDRTGSINATKAVVSEKIADGFTFVLPAERGPGGTTGGGDAVASLTFDDESITPWTVSGNPTLAYVASDAGKALSITGVQDYESIQSPAGILEPDTLYTFSMRARLPEGTAGSQDLRFVVKPAYNWVANATITADGWTDITGTYTLPADVDPAASQVYIGIDGEASVSRTVIIDDLKITKPAAPGGGDEVNLSFDFEDGLQGWAPRGDANGDPTVDVTTAEAHGGAQAAIVTNRDGQGDGIGYDVSDSFTTGGTYDITAWVKMAEGQETDDIWLSIRRTTDGSSSFDTIGQFTGITSGAWHQVQAEYTAPGGDTQFLYFETSYNTGGAGDFLVDDVTIVSQDPREPQLDLEPIKDTTEFPVGVAIDRRETLGAAADLVKHHFNQITPENHMKVEAWYSGSSFDTFRMHPEAIAAMDFAQENNLRVYGHVLVWHSQTPAWFYADAQGNPLTTSDADKQIMRDRMKTHINNVAKAISDEYGKFGSPTNPLVAWDVVNEVVNDGSEYADGLRRSEWYRILGEEFIDLAFEYANEAFNGTYAADGVEHPVTLFINDYNTEQGGKQDRYFALVNRLLQRDVPIDGVGHQFHVSLAMPVSALEGAIERFEPLPLQQVVTELDVTVGSPVTEANLIEQGYYYRDAFRAFREHGDKLFSASIWGLSDDRSWRSEQAPLVFDGQLQAKPAYYGTVDGTLDPRLIAEFAFAGSVPLNADAVTSPEWKRLPLHTLEDVAKLQFRWAADHLTAYVAVKDGDDEATDGLTFVVGDQTYTLGRDGEGDVEGVVKETATGWTAVVHLPLSGVAQNDVVEVDVRVTDGATTTAWNSPGASAKLTLIEELAFLEVAEAPKAPEIDGTVDEVWAKANAVTTGKQVSGTADGAATANVRTLWSGEGKVLYVLAEVTDDVVDLTGSDPWVQDSVEIFVDSGNWKNGPYRYDDTQVRISADNVVSFGTGDENFQKARVASKTSRTETGYVVEASITLLDDGGPGTFHGLDFQVNDATEGARTSIRTWAEPTGTGYQTTARWGVGQLVEAGTPPSFTDVPVTHPLYDEITWLAENGITTGYGDGTFRGTAPVIRYHMAAFLYRYADADYTHSGTPSFKDVAANHALLDEVEWLKAEGITEGYGDGTYRGNRKVTRGELTAFLWRMAGSPEPTTTPKFKDVPASHPFADAIAWGTENGVIKGYGDGTFRAGSSISRQHMAALLYRFDQGVAN